MIGTMFEVTESWQMPVNLLVAAVFIFCMVRGWKKGLLRSFLSLFSMFLSLWLAWNTKDIMATEISILPESWLGNSLLSGIDAVYTFFNQIAWCLVLFLVFRILFFVLDRILKKLHAIAGIRQISELLGGVFGGIQAVLWCLVLCVVFSTPLFINGSLAVDGTALGVVRDLGGSVMESPADPVVTSEAFSMAQNGMNKLTADERKVIAKWLNDNGYDQKGDYKQ